MVNFVFYAVAIVYKISYSGNSFTDLKIVLLQGKETVMSHLEKLLTHADYLKKKLPANEASFQAQTDSFSCLLASPGKEDAHILSAGDILKLYLSLADDAPAARDGLLPESFYRTCRFCSPEGYSCPDPEDLPHLMEHFSSQIYFSRHTLHPIELAAMACKRFLDISPFPGKNQELSLLILNYLLLRAGYPEITVPDEAKEEYHKALASSRSVFDMVPFSEFVAERVCEKLESLSQREY